MILASSGSKPGGGGTISCFLTIGSTCPGNVLELGRICPILHGKNTLARRSVTLPANLVPRGLNREEAAAYLGIGTTLFDELVKLGQMPAAKKMKGAVRWDRLAIDRAFEDLPRNGEESAEADDPWGRVRV